MVNFDELRAQIAQEFKEVETLDVLNELRIQYLGKKGKIADLMKQMKDVAQRGKT